MRRVIRLFKCHRSSGVSLIEVLIGIVIFTFGVLGLVGLQASMTRAQTSGKARADATGLAAEVVGAMWADAANIAKYHGHDCEGYDPCADWQGKVGRASHGGGARQPGGAASAGPD